MKCIHLFLKKYLIYCKYLPLIISGIDYEVKVIFNALTRKSTAVEGKKFLELFFGCWTLVWQHPMKSLSSLCPSVCLFVHPSLNFLNIGSLVFSNIVHDNSWPWYLVTGGDFWKKIWWPKFGLNQGLGFWLFSQVWFISFPWNWIQW